MIRSPDLRIEARRSNLSRSHPKIGSKGGCVLHPRLPHSPLTVAGPCGIFTHFPSSSGSVEFTLEYTQPERWAISLGASSLLSVFRMG